jgi:membrane protein YqaA with SNARE-associated domain
LVVKLSIEHPARMPLYVAMASLGSLLGCILLYFIARKGGEAFFHRKAGQHGAAIRHWVERNGFGGMLFAALLPPPTPFKVFVFAAAVFEQPLWSYTSAIGIARILRYSLVGFLAVRFGNDALPYIKGHKLEVALAVVVLVAVSYALSRVILKHHPPKETV